MSQASNLLWKQNVFLHDTLLCINCHLTFFCDWALWIVILLHWLFTSLNQYLPPNLFCASLRKDLVVGLRKTFVVGIAGTPFNYNKILQPQPGNMFFFSFVFHVCVFFFPSIIVLCVSFYLFFLSMFLVFSLF
jgi:hypothetical protein